MGLTSALLKRKYQGRCGVCTMEECGMGEEEFKERHTRRTQRRSEVALGVWWARLGEKADLDVTHSRLSFASPLYDHPEIR